VAGLTFNVDDPLALWRGQIDPLRTTFVAIHAYRDMWREVTAALDRAQHRSTFWRNHYTKLYVDGQMMAVRRVIRGPNVAGQVSLTRLLHAIERQPEAVTADFVVAVAKTVNPDPTWLDLVRSGFERDWGNGTGSLDPTIPRSDRAALLKAAEVVLAWADRTVAHIDTVQPTPPTFVELDQTIDHSTELLTGTHYSMSVIIPGDWQEPLMRPIFEPPPLSTGLSTQHR
jgi:hypothetical protein